jgi:hypothetical protein
MKPADLASKPDATAIVPYPQDGYTGLTREEAIARATGGCAERETSIDLPFRLVLVTFRELSNRPTTKSGRFSKNKAVSPMSPVVKNSDARHQLGYWRG